MTLRTTIALLMAALGLAGQARTQDDEPYDDAPAAGRARHVEGGVAIQRPDEPGSDAVDLNLPFLPGDRLFTDAAGRIELQFFEGSLLRLDRRSRLDFVEHDGSAHDRLVLSVASGSLYIRTRDDRRRADFEFETPDARVELREAGVYRLDVDRNETRLFVIEGTARLTVGRRSVRADTGEQTRARRGEAPEPAGPFEPWSLNDDFAMWDEHRGEAVWRADSQRYLPDELTPYASDFDANGDWLLEAEVGYVWRPRVAAGWQPYHQGRWVSTGWGWTWVGSESWGYAPYHYGRWNHSARLGWYWAPGRAWSPAWVSWQVSGDYVGWCPLGRGNRPVYAHSAHQSWQYARRAELGTREVARRRVSPAEVGAPATAAAPQPTRARLTRDWRVVGPEGATGPRHTRTKPTPGDYVPELATDQRVLPLPGSRPRPEGWRYDQHEASPTGASRREPASERHPATTRTQDSDSRYEWRGRVPRATPARDEQPTESSPAAETERPTERSRSRTEGQRAEPRSGSGNDDVLRRFFAPLRRDAPARGERAERESRPRADDGAERQQPERRAPRTEPQREQPRSDRQAPRAQPQREPARGEQPRPKPAGQDRAVRRTPPPKGDDQREH